MSLHVPSSESASGVSVVALNGWEDSLFNPACPALITHPLLPLDALEARVRRKVTIARRVVTRHMTQVVHLGN